MDHQRYRNHTDGFRCGERIEDDGSVRSVIFHCNLPSGREIEFSCREPSCGALEGEEKVVTLTDEDYAVVDPNFFDEGYTMAGSTGFKVWTGSRLLIETLVWPHETDCARLTEIQNRLGTGANVLELGAGVGVVGTYLASTGANVLLSDLPTLVENAIDPNLIRNKSCQTSKDSDGDECPSWFRPRGFKIGTGWASAIPIDWKIPVDTQLTDSQRKNIDFVVASDVVFLAEMLDSLLDTVADLFDSSAGNKPSFILSFQRRDAKGGKDSTAFTTVDGIIAAVKERGWALDCLAWRNVNITKDVDGGVIKDASEVFVFEIGP